MTGTSIEGSVSEFVSAAKQLASHFNGSSGFPVGCSLAIEITSESPSPVGTGDLPATHN
jgi:hypothetical protein